MRDTINGLPLPRYVQELLMDFHGRIVSDPRYREGVNPLMDDMLTELEGILGQKKQTCKCWWMAPHPECPIHPPSFSVRVPDEAA